jgi:benzoyl-CoA reductase subunit C
MTAIEMISQIANDIGAYLTNAHSKSEKKFLGVMHPVIPQEILYAAGLHPFRLFPFPGEPITRARAHLHADTSSIFRAIWDQVLKNCFPFMDGVVLPESCETVTYFSRGWKYHKPDDFVATIAGVRFSKTENGLMFFCKEIENLARTVEKYFGTTISANTLSHAIAIYNKNRNLMRQVLELKKEEIPPLSGVEALKIAMVSHVMDKEENNQLLMALLEELKNRENRQKPTVRLMVSGPCIMDYRLLETFEASGALVVADDTNMGTRSFNHTVGDSADPFMALAEGYSMIPCPFSISAENRLSYIINMASEYKVDGIVFAVEKACESEKMDFPYLEKSIKKLAKLPVTFIETEYLCDMAPIRTRIDAFVETLVK